MRRRGTCRETSEDGQRIAPEEDEACLGKQGRAALCDQVVARGRGSTTRLRAPHVRRRARRTPRAPAVRRRPAVELTPEVLERLGCGHVPVLGPGPSDVRSAYSSGSRNEQGSEVVAMASCEARTRCTNCRPAAWERQEEERSPRGHHARPAEVAEDLDGAAPVPAGSVQAAGEDEVAQRAPRGQELGSLARARRGVQRARAPPAARSRGDRVRRAGAIAKPGNSWTRKNDARTIVRQGHQANADRANPLELIQQQQRQERTTGSRRARRPGRSRSAGCRRGAEVRMPVEADVHRRPRSARTPGAARAQAATSPRS